MQKNELLKKLLESDNVQEIEIKSYAQLIKLLSGTELQDIEVLLGQLKKMAFIEDEDTLYNKLPMSVFYKQMPAVVDGDILVKVVILQQAEGLVLVIPENVVKTFQDLKEDPSMLAEKNSNVSLYAEIYNLDSADNKLHDLIKSVYLSSGNELKPFDLKDDLAKAKKEDEKDGEESNPEPLDLNFDEIEEDLPEIEDIKVNEEAYKRFKKQGNAIENFLESLYKKSNDILKKNVRTKLYKKVLVIEVNNKSIYQAYEAIPVVAKKLLSNFGEAIKRNKGTQLIDSFSKDGKRYFVVSEHLANNYWLVLNEDLEKLEDNIMYIEPNAKGVIKLNKSSVRKESRKVVAYKKGRKTVFVGSVI